MDAMTAEERRAAAVADPDAKPLTSDDLARMTRTPQAQIIRRALGLSQEQFSARFHIPLGTLRDWEQGRKRPDSTARAYLRVIGRNPSAVAGALEPSPSADPLAPAPLPEGEGFVTPPSPGPACSAP